MKKEVEINTRVKESVYDRLSQYKLDNKKDCKSLSDAIGLALDKLEKIKVLTETYSGDDDNRAVLSDRLDEILSIR